MTIMMVMIPFLFINDIQFFFSSLFLFLYLQRNNNIKATAVRHSISDSDLCERLIGNSNTHTLGAPACLFSYILSFQIVTCLYPLPYFFFFHRKKNTENE